jgi:hypothetical protein
MGIDACVPGLVCFNAADPPKARDLRYGFAATDLFHQDNPILFRVARWVSD